MCARTELPTLPQVQAPWPASLLKWQFDSCWYSFPPRDLVVNMLLA
jgi:hypothetical protein